MLQVKGGSPSILIMCSLNQIRRFCHILNDVTQIR